MANDSNSSSIRLAVEHCLYSQILPVPSFKDDEDLSAWVDRLLIVYQNLDEPGRKAFLSYTRLADRLVLPFEILNLAKLIFVDDLEDLLLLLTLARRIM